jgi:hypothetical protein
MFVADMMGEGGQGRKLDLGGVFPDAYASNEKTRP